MFGKNNTSSFLCSYDTFFFYRITTSLSDQTAYIIDCWKLFKLNVDIIFATTLPLQILCFIVHGEGQR